ncbi:hypothetical protein PY650_10170 [Rhizobium calliandrae]|uniref:Uncharacterized protein n=1 Tax=Rhizobium calliandrae TaxID=1312182 RepID=A0ABT7KFR6_9HYPH|nr:hypothetical protein [Rhizobium calliandrae]MDL2406024.1 hypothetical protein [Rhizobium calliandrae]
MAILKLMILTLKSIKQSAAEKKMVFSSRDHADRVATAKSAFSPLSAGPHRQIHAVFWAGLCL